MTPIALIDAPAASLGFQIATWILSTFAGAFIYGVIVGRWKARIEARLAEEAAARVEALRLEQTVRKGAFDLEAQARRAEIASEAQARASDIAASDRERSGLQSEIVELKRRLERGDKKFDEDMKSLATLTSRMETVAARLEGHDNALAQFVTRPECERAHTALEKLIDEETLMALREATKFRADVLGKLEVAAAEVKEDFEDAAKDLRIKVGLDLDPRNAAQAAEIIASAARLAGYQAAFEALEFASKTVQDARIVD